MPARVPPRARARALAFACAHTFSLLPRLRVHKHSFPSGASELTMCWFCRRPTSQPHLAAPPRYPTLPLHLATKLRLSVLLAAPPRRPIVPPHLANKVRLSVLATPPRRSTSPLRFASPSSSPPQVAAPSRRPTSPLNLARLRPALWGPEPVAAPSPGPGRWRLCLQAPTCLHPFTCPYGTDARGQSHHPLACSYSTDARGQASEPASACDLTIFFH